LFEALPTIRATLALTSRVSRLSKGRGIRSERLNLSISRLLFLRKRTLPGLCRGPPARAGLATGPNVRLPTPIAAFGPQGRLSQLSARALNRSRDSLLHHD
jgi:hypothetical protein